MRYLVFLCGALIREDVDRHVCSSKLASFRLVSAGSFRPKADVARSV